MGKLLHDNKVYVASIVGNKGNALSRDSVGIRFPYSSY